MSEQSKKENTAGGGLSTRETSKLCEKPPGFSTLAVHGGETRPKLGNSLATPIVQTATYTFADTQELHDHFQHKIDREEYGRYGNPTQRVAEKKLAALEGAEDCLLFSSGMAAVTTALLAACVRGAWGDAEALRALFLPLEDRRSKARVRLCPGSAKAARRCGLSHYCRSG